WIHGHRVSSAFLAVLLAASGFAALVYQVLWVKQLGLLIGVEVYAVATVVSAFFAGLATGSAVLGARADASPRPLALYAWLELGVAVTGLATTLLLSSLPAPYAALEHALGRVAWLLPFVLMAVPAIMMGGTLPALVRAARPPDEAIGATSGALYAANTAGGVLGVLAVPFVLVPLLGVRGTGGAAAATNLLLAATAALLAGRSAVASAGRREGRAATAATADSRLALVLYAIAGGIALGLEVVWSQAIVQLINTRTYSFALMLATYLTGLVV